MATEPTGLTLNVVTLDRECLEEWIDMLDDFQIDEVIHDMRTVLGQADQPTERSGSDGS